MHSYAGDWSAMFDECPGRWLSGIALKQFYYTKVEGLAAFSINVVKFILGTLCTYFIVSEENFACRALKIGLIIEPASC